MCCAHCCPECNNLFFLLMAQRWKNPRPIKQCIYVLNSEVWNHFLALIKCTCSRESSYCKIHKHRRIDSNILLACVTSGHICYRSILRLEEHVRVFDYLASAATKFLSLLWKFKFTLSSHDLRISHGWFIWMNKWLIKHQCELDHHPKEDNPIVMFRNP